MGTVRHILKVGCQTHDYPHMDCDINGLGDVRGASHRNPQLPTASILATRKDPPGIAAQMEKILDTHLTEAGAEDCWRFQNIDGQ